MTTDQMRAEFEKWADAKCLPLTRINWKDGTTSEYAYTATFDAWQVWQAAYAAGRKAEQAEVEWLRAEVQRLDIAGTHTCHDDCPKLPCVQRREIEWLLVWNKRWRDVSAKLRLTVAQLSEELAAAKAASMVPVKVLNIFEGTYESDRYIELRTDAEADTFTDWLRDRMEDTPPAT